MVTVPTLLSCEAFMRKTLMTLFLANAVVLMSEMCAFKDYRLFAVTLVIQLLATNSLRLTKTNTNVDRFDVRVVFLASVCGAVSYTYFFAMLALHIAISLLVLPESYEVIHEGA
jgi:hypothetical protein